MYNILKRPPMTSIKGDFKYPKIKMLQNLKLINGITGSKYRHFMHEKRTKKKTIK